MLSILAAAIMAASFFLPWFDFFGTEYAPVMMLGETAPPLDEFPWQAYAFLASFALAALGALLALVRAKAGFIMVVAGGIPYAMIAESAINARGQLREVGLPLPQGGDASQVLDLLREFVAIGAPAYFISAALLVVIGLVRLARGA